mmetsp:Transcript_9963/g.25705  ORF Transcript_9963/g.25705 Transcript_9963/m.25705 type:complete len:205 (+) Transcript_9963:442-1056(+)
MCTLDKAITYVPLSPRSRKTNLNPSNTTLKSVLARHLIACIARREPKMTCKSRERGVRNQQLLSEDCIPLYSRKHSSTSQYSATHCACPLKRAHMVQQLLGKDECFYSPPLSVLLMTPRSLLPVAPGLVRLPHFPLFMTWWGVGPKPPPFLAAMGWGLLAPAGGPLLCGAPRPWPPPPCCCCCGCCCGCLCCPPPACCCCCCCW